LLLVGKHLICHGRNSWRACVMDRTVDGRAPGPTRLGARSSSWARQPRSRGISVMGLAATRRGDDPPHENARRTLGPQGGTEARNGPAKALGVRTVRVLPGRVKRWGTYAEGGRGDGRGVRDVPGSLRTRR